MTHRIGFSKEIESLSLIFQHLQISIYNGKYTVDMFVTDL